MNESLFRGYFMGGFECSTHRVIGGRRLDLVASTRHDRFAVQDYARLRSLGLLVAREGLRWHLIERQPGRYDFSTALPMIQAARASGVQVLWDICHYGWPDWLDIWSAGCVDRFAAFAHAFARLLSSESDEPAFVVPVNEISFLSWAAGEVGIFHPYALRRGGELKAQLVRATVAAQDAMREISAGTRFIHADPVINVIAHPLRPEQAGAAEAYRRAQYEAADMVAGRLRPELGGSERQLDIIGLNYYFDNQWYYRSGRKIRRGHPLYRPLRCMLSEWYERYRRPLFIAETGIEDAARPEWLRWVVGEVEAATAAGARIEGVCLYPILNHPGWVNDRHCHNGLWDYPDDTGHRPAYEPLARELRGQLRRRLRQPSSLQAD